MTRRPNALSPDPNAPMGLMLSGGGARGAFQVGVLKVLLEDPRGLQETPKIISGTSAGSLNGALLAAGLSPADMLGFWLGLADAPPVHANARFFASVRRALDGTLRQELFRAVRRRTRELSILGSLLNKHAWYKGSGLMAMALEFFLTARFDTVSALLNRIDAHYLFDMTPLRDRLSAFIGAQGIPAGSPFRLAINTVDIATGNVVRIVNHRPNKRPGAAIDHYRYEPNLSLDMIMASAAIPLLFNPVTVNGTELWDGGLLVNSPMAPAIALGARRLIPVLVTVAAPPGRRLSSLGHALERLVDTFLENAYTNDRKRLLDRNALSRRGLPDAHLSQVQLFEALRPLSSDSFNAGSYLFFERDAMLSMYRAGKLAARRWLSLGPPLDSPGPDP
jgi:NTE family protein